MSRDLTPIKAFQANENQLSGHRKENPELLETVISVLITQLSDSLHSSIRMNENQIAMCAEDIIAEFWYYKLEEIIWILNNARRKKTFNRLDQSVIFECFTDYEKDRQRIIEQDKIEKMKKSEQEKAIEEQAIRDFYEKSKNGQAVPYVSIIAKIEKEKRGNEDNFQKWRAGYMAQKIIKDAKNNTGESIEKGELKQTA
jgi:hypothetical protein